LRSSARAADAGYRADGGLSAEFVVLAASVAGSAHRLAGRRDEDAYAWVQPEPGRLALLVADGVSAAGRGGEGADLAVDAAAGYLLRSAQGWGPRECAGALAAADELLARAGGQAAAELSTTLVVALLSCDFGGGARATVSRVGDSTAFTLTKGAGWQEVFASARFDGDGGGAGDAGGSAGDDIGDDDGGELSTTSTAVLPAAGGVSRAGVAVVTVELAPATALVLLTDGLANPLRDGPTTVAPALASLLAAGLSGELSPLDLAHAADFSRRGALDDRTILVAWPRPGAASPEVP
jgi:serine/threonine protein phosphatase PrpC